MVTKNAERNGSRSAVGGEAPTNSAEELIALSQPYVLRVRIEGMADLLFHRYSVEAVEAKGSAAKGSKAKKTDNLESYVYRNADGGLCLPGEYFRQSIIHAAKFQQDPRSPRKSAMDLFKAGVLSLTDLSPVYAPIPQGKERLGEDRRAEVGPGEVWHGFYPLKNWSYEDRRRALVQRNAVTRVRPAILAGWRAEFDLLINIPEYITRERLMQAMTDAGRLVGVGDFRPSYGRYSVVGVDGIEGG